MGAVKLAKRRYRTTIRKIAATYNGAHHLVRKVRGPATEQLCNECGSQAQDWAYDHSDPNETVTSSGSFSMDVDHYVPMCTSCHIKGDIARTGAVNYAKTAEHRQKLSEANKGGKNRAVITCEDCGRCTTNGLRCASCALKRFHRANPDVAQKRRKARCSCGMETISYGGIAKHLRKNPNHRRVV